MLEALTTCYVNSRGRDWVSKEGELAVVKLLKEAAVGSCCLPANSLLDLLKSSSTATIQISL